MPGRPLVLAAAALLGGCAMPAARDPSLLPRAVETRGEAERTPAAPMPTADPELDQAIAAARATLRAVAGEADAVLAEPVPSDAPAAGSEAWIAAQVALARLDEVRARASDVATDLAQRAIARAAAGGPAYPALEASAREAQALLDRIDQGIATRQAALPPA